MNREEKLFCSQQANRIGFIPRSIQKALGIRLVSIFQSPSSLGEAVNFESNQEPLDSKVAGALLCKTQLYSGMVLQCTRQTCLAIDWRMVAKPGRPKESWGGK